MNQLHKNMERFKLNDGFYATDGGLETTLVFHEGIELNHFAAFELLLHQEGRDTLRRYFHRYIDISLKHGMNFLLESPTWRANKDWGFRLGYGHEELYRINKDAIAFLREIKAQYDQNGCHIPISGNIGPRGDGYMVDKLMSAEEAMDYHKLQIEAFADAGADMVSAFTMNNIQEALGIVLAARENGMPVVISYTVETDGCLPDGSLLKDAIQKVDDATDGYTMYYMVNCAHPQHFKQEFTHQAKWLDRIGGIRANASTKSHQELDNSDTLDVGDKHALALNYLELNNLLPRLKVIGGCCGTDHTHIEAITEAFSAKRHQDGIAKK